MKDAGSGMKFLCSFFSYEVRASEGRLFLKLQISSDLHFLRQAVAGMRNFGWLMQTLSNWCTLVDKGLDLSEMRDCVVVSFA